jgi:transposase
MTERLVSDEFWSRVELVIPVVERRFRHPGRSVLMIVRVLRRSCMC